MYRSIIVVIPSLEPEKKLIQYVEGLVKKGFKKIVIVDDGSGEAFQEIFSELRSKKECIVLTHEANYGKGVALKTGYRYIEENLPEYIGIVTADADGQHLIHDVCNIAEKVQGLEKGMVLGIRNFTNPTTPIKSRIGNRFSTLMFFCLFGKWLTDTQTGLRGFQTDLLPFMLQISGERYEYEMQVIIECSHKKLPMIQEEITTVYEEENTGSHFKAVKDSARVMKVIFGNFVKYILSSAVSACVDLSLAWILLEYLKAFIPNHDFLRVLSAVTIARFVSMTVNYGINKYYVFKEKKGYKKSIIKYLSLCFVNMLCSALITYFVSRWLDIDEKPIKAIGDIFLFLVNYQVQKHWVFNYDNGGMADEK